jgi:hypothetical protein
MPKPRCVELEVTICDLKFEVAVCDLKKGGASEVVAICDHMARASSAVNWNMKSGGIRSLFRRYSPMPKNPPPASLSVWRRSIRAMVRCRSPAAM